jgi:hypothetical protein
MSNPSNLTEKQKSCRTLRREVWWLDLDAKNQSLESIKRRFEDCLDRFPSLSSSSNSLLRHITSTMDNKIRHNLHQCPGYLREEITLTSDSDVSKSAIISHTFPSQSEVCSICGQLVQYKYNELSIVDGEKRETNSSNGSHYLPRLQPSGIPSPHSPTAGPPSPVLSDMSDSGSIWIPPSPTLSNHSGRRYTTTLRNRQDSCNQGSHTQTSEGSSPPSTSTTLSSHQSSNPYHRRPSLSYTHSGGSGGSSSSTQNNGDTSPRSMSQLVPLEVLVRTAGPRRDPADEQLLRRFVS